MHKLVLKNLILLLLLLPMACTQENSAGGKSGVTPTLKAHLKTNRIVRESYWREYHSSLQEISRRSFLAAPSLSTEKSIEEGITYLSQFLVKIDDYEAKVLDTLKIPGDDSTTQAAREMLTPIQLTMKDKVSELFSKDRQLVECMLSALRWAKHNPDTFRVNEGKLQFLNKKSMEDYNALASKVVSLEKARQKLVIAMDESDNSLRQGEAR